MTLNGKKKGFPEMSLSDKFSSVVSHCGIFLLGEKSDKENFLLKQQRIFAFDSEWKKERFSRDEFVR
ncbi:hypothetical protein AFK68_00805 [Hydrocoleum sp. CS-953]|uniref:hypothetical protein n=1 Tax=Hydrocoleum sp. CS-953 TaxID=1671698 RepID=UPI000B9A70EF|nr:hypothetical protein [Hydrocoleum sp. CS-953]OZH56034.1 hypothetical protein AFK68_00805 [Hydrocoleum sp. CS-953]